MKKIWITSDCTCNMSEELLDEYNVEVIHFYITTDHGCFKDMAEITASNVVEYFENGGTKISTMAPDVPEYTEFFERMLEKYEEIVHITICSKLSLSYQNAVTAAEQFGGRVKVFDSKHLATGMAHLIIRGVEMARENKTAEEIQEVLTGLRDKISTGFIAENADYLYRTGRVNK
ncbi:MAG: DegV family EDD domain-containing protein, partial [Lachnospiraceae bacterium]|nr:DegV family EDD domain-containing protein [Lachnospiraceae bacterium]